VHVLCDDAVLRYTLRTGRYQVFT